MESMTNAPYLVPGARAGLRIGDAPMVDAMMHDGLTCAFEHHAMGEGTERDAAAAAISRAAMDVFAARSHERAAAAQKDGRFDAELVAVPIPQRKGEPVLVDTDEGIRPGTTPESLAGLRGAFGGAGNVTAGNASQISDGACAVVVVSPGKAAELGLSPLGEVVGYGQVAGPDTNLLHQPSNAIRKALAKAGMAVSQIDLFEINEAFAAVGLASMADLGIDEAVTNVNGGAIALGHPIGASGNRLALTLLHELRRRGGTYGAAALCGGGGQGDALLVRAL
jgi:acetyl-CoA C-acetyltransferase